MRPTFRLVSLVALCGLLAASSARSQTPPYQAQSGPAADQGVWAPTFGQAQRLAAERRRLVLVHFWNDNCPPCRSVERNVFSLPEVERALSINYVPVRVNVSDEPELARRYQIERWPTDLVMTPDGVEIYRSVSEQDPNRYIALLDRVATHARVGMASPRNPIEPQLTNENHSTVMSSRDEQGFSPRNYDDRSLAQRTSPDADRAFAPGGQGGQGDPRNFAGGGFDPRGSGGFDPRNAGPSGGGFDPRTVSPPSGQFENSRPSSRDVAGTRPGGSFETPRDAAIGDPMSSPRPGPTANPYAPPNGPADPANPSAPWNGAPDRAQPNSPQPNVSQPTAPQPAAPTTAAAPSAGPSLAIDGFCPVTLLEQRRWKKADPRFGAIHRDRTYLFLGAEEQQRFLANPDKYSPMLSGYDPVRFAEQRQLVDGKRQHGLTYGDQMYLFTDEASLQQFWKQPNAYVRVVQEAMRASSPQLIQR